MAYGSEAGFQGWLDLNGYSLDAGAPSILALLHRGTSYIDATYGGHFTGVPADETQPEQWPRSGATAYGRAIADEVVPQSVVTATYTAAYAEAQGITLSRAFDPLAPIVKRRRLEGVAEREFFEPQADLQSVSPIIPVIDALLAPLLRDWVDDSASGSTKWLARG